MKIAEQIIVVTEQLRTVSTTPRLDAELLLAHVIQQPRSHIYKSAQETLSPTTLQSLRKLVQRRIAGETIAHIIGKKEFWSLSLQVNQYTLIPRPETESLVELALRYLPAEQKLQVADLGTGCGAIALAIASERPNWRITATDIDGQALQLARVNAQQLAIENVEFRTGNWFQPLIGDKFSAIISNPPYIAENERQFTTGIEGEPEHALFTAENGYRELRIIIEQAESYLEPQGLLILEHGWRQGNRVAELLVQNGYEILEQHRYAICGCLSQDVPSRTR